MGLVGIDIIDEHFIEHGTLKDTSRAFDSTYPLKTHYDIGKSQFLIENTSSTSNGWFSIVILVNSGV